jgi:ATP citrate (pro-S)-lyase
MVAGGGASVAYADTISDLGFGHELANYGEYSGAPSRDMTYEYAKTILQLIGQVRVLLSASVPQQLRPFVLLLRAASTQCIVDAVATTAICAQCFSRLWNGQEEIALPKVLIIGGGIANFTDIAATFYGIIDALRDYSATLIKHRVSIWVRRGGPNCQARPLVPRCVLRGHPRCIVHTVFTSPNTCDECFLVLGFPGGLADDAQAGSEDQGAHSRVRS